MIVIATLLLILQLACSETIVNLFEWSHEDVAKECVRFLAPYHYDAVQVSPVAEHVILPGRPWWERYQPFSYRLVSRSGNEAAFKKMVETCNKVGVRVYVEVVFNHMAKIHPKGTKGTDGSQPDTSNKNYTDVPYGPDDFHPTCAIRDMSNILEVRNCELLGMQDLNQTKEYVRDKIVDFLNHLIGIGVAGFKINAAKHMDPSDLKVIYHWVRNLHTKWFPECTKPHIYQEVLSNQVTDKIKPQDYTGISPALDFKYGFEMARAFTGGNKLKFLHDYGESWKLLPWKDSVVFIDDQDTQRKGVLGKSALTYKQSKQYKMATGFMLAWSHEQAVVMSSYSFDSYDQGPPAYPVPVNDNLTCSGGWICEHRWRQIYSMVHFAKIVKGTQVTNWWTNGNNQIAFCRGNKGFIAINAENIDLDKELVTCLEPGEYCDVVSGLKEGKSCTGTKVTVRSGGVARIKIPANAFDGFFAIHSESKI